VAKLGDTDVNLGAMDVGDFWIVNQNVNGPIALFAENASANFEMQFGDFTGGNSANSLKVSVAYLIINTLTGQFE
jgi:hypothetical protein